MRDDLSTLELDGGGPETRASRNPGKQSIYFRKILNVISIIFLQLFTVVRFDDFCRMVVSRKQLAVK